MSPGAPPDHTGHRRAGTPGIQHGGLPGCRAGMLGGTRGQREATSPGSSERARTPGARRAEGTGTVQRVRRDGCLCAAGCRMREFWQSSLCNAARQPPTHGSSRAHGGNQSPRGEPEPPCSAGQMAQPRSGEGEIGGGFVGRTMSSKEGRRGIQPCLLHGEGRLHPPPPSPPPRPSLHPEAGPSPSLPPLQGRWCGDGGAGGMGAPRQAMLEGCGRGKGKGCGRDAGGW